MAIDFYCTCGRLLNAPDGSGGKTVRCPSCKAKLIVPRPEGSDAIDLVVTRQDDSPRLKPATSWSWFGQRNPMSISRGILFVIAFTSVIWYWHGTTYGIGGILDSADEMEAMGKLTMARRLETVAYQNMQDRNDGQRTSLICFTIAVAGIACSHRPKP